MKLNKYSFGVGDRFAQQGKAQLKAFETALHSGMEITPVWNKSFREHSTVHSEPEMVRREADQAVKELEWKNAYLVDADHIQMNTVDAFIEASDFFTIDVADQIDTGTDPEMIEYFIKINSRFMGYTRIPGIEEPFNISRDFMYHVGERFLEALQEAARIYQHIQLKKGAGFIAEVSMDEVEEPQTPAELLLILSGLAHYGVQLQTIAPKFTGRFNKGVDYVGDIDAFRKEFEEDLLVIDYAVREFHLPGNLKLSVHSGSDKFSIYPSIHDILKQHDKGVHVKTAGTTWLEELAGLALSGGEGLRLARKIYEHAVARFEELTGPYATVIDIPPDQLPKPSEVDQWDNRKFVETLRHDPSNPRYNPAFRQLLHVAYKVAAEYGPEFIKQVRANESIIGPLVTDNIYLNHLKPIFLGQTVSS